MSNTIKYSVYIIRGKAPSEQGIYVGYTKNFPARKYSHKSASSKAGGSFVDNYIFENGGWDRFVMYELETGITDKQKALEKEGEYIDSYKANLNKNRSGVDSVHEFGLYYQAWMADYRMQNGDSYSKKWRERNPDYFKLYYASKQPLTKPTTRAGKKIHAEFLRLGRIRIQ